jgi:hypothetical protein
LASRPANRAAALDLIVGSGCLHVNSLLLSFAPSGCGSSHIDGTWVAGSAEWLR